MKKEAVMILSFLAIFVFSIGLYSIWTEGVSLSPKDSVSEARTFDIASQQARAEYIQENGEDVSIQGTLEIMIIDHPSETNPGDFIGETRIYLREQSSGDRYFLHNAFEEGIPFEHGSDFVISGKAIYKEDINLESKNFLGKELDVKFSPQVEEFDYASNAKGEISIESFELIRSARSTSSSRSGEDAEFYELLDEVNPYWSFNQGNQKTLAILMTNHPEEPLLIPSVAEYFLFDDSNPHSITNLLDELTYGNIHFFGDVVGPYDETYSHMDVLQELAQNGVVDLAEYKIIIFINNKGLGGIAHIGPYTNEVNNEILFYKSMTIGGSFLNNEDYSDDYFGTILHELGHSFGAHHANYYGCDEPEDPTGEYCTSIVYRDPFDLLGPSHRSGRYSILHSFKMGFLNPSDIHFLGEDESDYEQEFLIFPVESRVGVKGIYVPLLNIESVSTRDIGPEGYWIEYRTTDSFIDFPSLMFLDAGAAGINVLDGAQVRLHRFQADAPMSGKGDAQLIDHAPHSYIEDPYSVFEWDFSSSSDSPRFTDVGDYLLEVLDSRVPIGESYTFPGTGITMHVLGKTNEGLRVSFTATECGDLIDNDGDGYIDWPEDPSCQSPNDDDEYFPTQCHDDFDNDNDGYIDWPEDPSCSSAEDDDETNPPQCSDGIDNDYDGQIDLNDVHCANSTDNFEGESFGPDLYTVSAIGELQDCDQSNICTVRQDILIKNLGNEMAENSRAVVTATANDDFTFEQSFGISDLRPGEEKTIRPRYDVASGTEYSLSFAIALDVDSEVSEGNENNNILSGPVFDPAEEFMQPDLDIVSMDTTVVECKLAGGVEVCDVRVDVTVINAGNEDIDDASDAEISISNGDFTESQRTPIARLDVNETDDFSRLLRDIPSGQLYTATVVLDVDGDIDESDENNNVASTNVLVVEP